VARLDLGWREAMIGVEYDGAYHREDQQHSRDLARHNRLRALGWTVYQVDRHGARDLRSLATAIRRHLP
jgi:very-short-patch-repair endonuclease